MKNKGFTLIELIAVMGIIAILILLTAPSLINQIDSTRQKNYENFVNDLCLATESYINANGDDERFISFKNANDTVTLQINDLISSGYVKSNIKNPKTKEKISSTAILTVTLTTDKTYTCTLN